ncbi:MAG: hypothetical protein DMG57_20965 [Acidobacteria bacterium]|nr:MAG: hypothetical protein DMG57_20965 [Acidobacteriota bacterium]
MTRRDFAKKSAVVASVGATVSKATARAAAAQSSISARRTASVDQNPIRRRGTGLRAIDPDRASSGLTLFAPMFR